MFKIGEFSKLTQVSVRMLRYYEENGLLKPAATDKFTNYRMYSANQIETLSKITFLRDLGFGVSEMRELLKDFDNDKLSDTLKRKHTEIKESIAKETARLGKIELAQNDIEKDKIAIHCNVNIKTVPEIRVLSLRRTVPDYYSEGSLWKELSAYAKESGLNISDSTFSIYHDSEYLDESVDIEICAPVSGEAVSRGDFKVRIVEEVPYMAFTMVYGGFENISEAYKAFAEWLPLHSSFKMSGCSRQIVHLGPWNEPDPEKYLIELQIPIEKI